MNAHERELNLSNHGNENVIGKFKSLGMLSVYRLPRN